MLTIISHSSSDFHTQRKCSPPDHRHLLLNQLIEIALLKLLDGNVPFIRIGIDKCLIDILQIILDLVVCSTDDRLKSKSADQRNTACHFLSVHLGKRFVQHNETDCRVAVHFRRQVNPVNLCKAGKKCHIQRVLPFSAGIFLDHFAQADFHVFFAMHDLLHIEG